MNINKNICSVLMVITLSVHTTSMAQWVQTPGPYLSYANAFAVSGTNIFLGTNGAGVFLCTDNGTTWTAVNSGLASPYISSLAVSGTNLYAGTFRDGVFLSSDTGKNWNNVSTGLTNLEISSLAAGGTGLFAGTFGGGIFRSTDNGANWTAVNSGIMALHIQVYSLTVIGANLFAGTVACTGQPTMVRHGRLLPQA